MLQKLMLIEERQNDSIVNRLIKILQSRAGENILLYTPFKQEPNILDILKIQDKKFYFPRVVGRELILYQYHYNQEFINGAYGLLEPPYHWIEVPLSTIDTALIPGLAFDKSGRRLGRGKGFYDRLFSLPNHAIFKIGCCWSFQCIDNIPTESHDIKMDCVCTDVEKFDTYLL